MPSFPSIHLGCPARPAVSGRHALHQAAPFTAMSAMRFSNGATHGQEGRILVVQQLSRLQRHFAGRRLDRQKHRTAQAALRIPGILTVQNPAAVSAVSAAGGHCPALPAGFPSARLLLQRCARLAGAGETRRKFIDEACCAPSLDRCSSVHCDGSPDGSYDHGEPLGDPSGRRYSVPVPAGETTGSLCARMCASKCRPQPRHGSGVIAVTADGFDDGLVLYQPTGGSLLDGGPARSSAPFSCHP